MYAENQIFNARRKQNLHKTNDKSMRFLATEFMVI